MGSKINVMREKAKRGGLGQIIKNLEYQAQGVKVCSASTRVEAAEIFMKGGNIEPLYF